MKSDSREIFEQALRMEQTYRVPAMYQYLSGGPEPFNAVGLQMRECYYNPEKFARACKMIQESYGYDNIMAGWGSIILEAHAHGSEIYFQQDNTYPKSKAPFLNTPEKIDSLQPVDPMDNELLSIRLKASGILSRRYGEEYAVMGTLLTPAVVAVELRGFEDQLMDMFCQRDLAHQYLKILTESVHIHGERLMEQGVEMVFLENDFTASEGYVPIEAARELDLAYAQKCMQSLKSMNFYVMVHNCTVLPLIEEQVETLRPHAIHYNAMSFPDHRKICAKIKGKVCLCPGIAEDLVFDGPAEKIASAVKSLSFDVADHASYIMGSAYEVPFHTKPEHQLALVKAIVTPRSR